MCYIYSRAQNKLIVNISNKMIFSFLVFRTLITMCWKCAQSSRVVSCGTVHTSRTLKCTSPSAIRNDGHTNYRFFQMSSKIGAFTVQNENAGMISQSKNRNAEHLINTHMLEHPCCVDTWTVPWFQINFIAP